MRYKSIRSVIAEIAAKKKNSDVEVETPLDNPEAEQDETAADVVMKKYCSRGPRLDQLKKKIIDNT